MFVDPLIVNCLPFVTLVGEEQLLKEQDEVTDLLIEHVALYVNEYMWQQFALEQLWLTASEFETFSGKYFGNRKTEISQQVKKSHIT